MGDPIVDFGDRRGDRRLSAPSPATACSSVTPSPSRATQRWLPTCSGTVATVSTDTTFTAHAASTRRGTSGTGGTVTRNGGVEVTDDAATDRRRHPQLHRHPDRGHDVDVPATLTGRRGRGVRRRPPATTSTTRCRGTRTSAPTCDAPNGTRAARRQQRAQRRRRVQRADHGVVRLVPHPVLRLVRARPRTRPTAPRPVPRTRTRAPATPSSPTSTAPRGASGRSCTTCHVSHGSNAVMDGRTARLHWPTRFPATSRTRSAATTAGCSRSTTAGRASSATTRRAPLTAGDQFPPGARIRSPAFPEPDGTAVVALGERPPRATSHAPSFIPTKNRQCAPGAMR